MTATPYLVHGVFWPAHDDIAGSSDAPPVLRLQAPDGTFRETALDDGTRLGFRLAAEGKSCLGHYRVHGPARRDHVLCRNSSPSVRGHQCDRCFMQDEFRLMHEFHRGGGVPSGLRSYLMQPHWLYVATFADGASKVGTASDLRKWQRLAEQGAVAASYVARAGDGRVVRVLEDLVTSNGGLPQQVRSAAKAAALAAPAPADRIKARNSALAAVARKVASTAGEEGFELVDETWTRPGLAGRLCSETARHAYPHSLESDAHGFTIRSVCGSFALASLDGADLEFVVDLGRLKGRTIELGDHRSDVPAVQEALF
ncbi:DUF2797 domain-containing protein [Pseudarthrobacter sp. NamB4]|uniref:DUF2797 domain-containing protein n=1 Tax=Pseudarthrobacter sp. NamB4 TaxID=2576837 RepID=UPI0010FDBAE5|nr:DUF2797 domain-containing protein [Pseudarthrobacter sp. NamB4]TLM74632.1 DUF2797 domain-containing protein [Pseudarthrobacter sp. NamB4]